MRGVAETDLGVFTAVIAILALVIVLFDTAVLIGTVSALGRLSRAFQANQANQGDPDTAGSLLAPLFSAVDMDGNVIDNESLTGRLTALLFVSTTCTSCAATLIEMQALKHRARDGVIVVCQADTAACAGLAESLGIQARIIADESHELSQLFEVNAVPFAVVLASGTHIKSRGYPLREQLQEAATDHEGVRDG